MHDLEYLPPIPVISIPPPSPTPPNAISSTLSDYDPQTLQTPPLNGCHRRRTASLASSKVSPTPSSLTSLVQSDGEDFDAFLVRNTYAQLDAFGVKGDGYEDGIERTRARMGNGTSLLNAEGALTNGAGKDKDLNPKELEALASLDRYGFFDIPSHDRLVRLPLLPLQKRLSRVSAGSPTLPASPGILPIIPPMPPPLREFSRIGKWTRMLVPESRDVGSNVQTWTVRPAKESKLRERTYKGIPDRWRGAAWELFVSKATHCGKDEVARLEAVYRAELEKPSAYDVQIDLDVPRTISGHIMFRTRYGGGQRSLFHVLHSFSLHCSHCGYVQGMGPIAATLICYTSPSHAYATLVRLHSHPFYSLHSIFSPGFPGLLEAIYVQERIIETTMPDVFKSFKDNMISTTSYATKWYITLFANTVPFQCQLRFWDVFLLEGKDLFVVVAVAIVWVFRDYITSASANFETVLSLLSSFFVPQDENMLLAWIRRTLDDKKLRANIVRWRSDWQTLVAEGKDGSALL